MKAINSYIIEKFKITKDIVVNKGKESFSKGEYILRVQYFIPRNKKPGEINKITLDAIKFLNMESENRIFYENNSKGYVTTPKVSFNSNSYYEYIHVNTFKADTGGTYKVIFLLVEAALDFIDDVLKSNGKSIKNILKNYYNIEDTDIFSSDVNIDNLEDIDTIKETLKNYYESNK